MATFPKDMSVAVDELVSAIAEMESHLESARAERDEAKARQVELELENGGLRRELALAGDQNERLFSETREALERQTATAEILKVIASSPSDVQPIFEAIASSAKRLLDGFSTTVLHFIDDELHLVAYTPTSPEADEALKSSFPRKLAEFPTFALVRNGETVQFADTEAEEVPEANRELARLRGFRSVLFTPLMNRSTPVGMISVTRAEPGAFGPHHVQLLQTFADQAVIAIENTRLFNETKEALERQTATAEILKVIASSPSDVQPVFDAIAHSANRLIGGFSAAVFRYIDGKIHLAAFTPTDPAGDAVLQSSFPVPLKEFPPYQLTRDGAPAELPDTDLEPAARDIASARGYRSMLFAPLMNDGVPVGIITVTRVAPGPFGEQHTRLLQMFADQAVIAIKNVGLFNEVQQRTNDLSESLRQQTAVGDVLKTISRSTFDLQPVLDTLVNSAAQLCDADMAFIMRRVGDEYRAGAAVGYTEAYIDFLTNHPLAVSRGTVTGRAVLEKRPVQITDVVADPEYTLHETTTLAGQRTTLGVPLLRENEPIGVIVLARQRVEPFTEKQIDLVATFADQAVIAIENVRLFNEVQQRTEDLSEALQQQIATADVLKVISRSAFDLEIVLNTLTESAARLCNADMAAVTRQHPDGGYHHATRYNFPPEWDRFAQATRVYPGRGSLVGRVLLEGKAVQIPDVLADPEYAFPEQQRAGGYRTLLGVPLLREGQPVGVLFLGRTAVEPFSDKQIELVQIFADQAVIAIENVRLFDEVQAKTRDLSEALTYQTGSANILKVIASSPTDVGPVLKAIVESACELCEAYDCIAFLRDGDYLRFSAYHGPIPMDFDKWPINRKWVTGRCVVDQRPVHVHDLMAEGDEFPDGREMSARMGHRTMVAVPLLREGESIGAIILRRTEVNPFTDKQVNLLQTFADQAVIAIGNVRLFEEVQAKSRDLTEALTYQTGSANILRVIASSPTDINPVFKAIVESACELCDAYDAVLRLKNGDNLYFSAHHGPISTFRNERPIDRGWTAGRAVIDQTPIQIGDLLSPEGDDFPEARELARQQGHRTVLSVPLLREGESLGAITLRRQEVHPFGDKQIALLQTFADQAVIAIGNVRLFEEVQAKTRDLSEALTYQTGSSNILRVIASSPTDVQPVLKAIVESACELCDANDAIVMLEDAGELRSAAHFGPIPEGLEKLPIARTRVVGRAFIEHRPVHVRDFHSAEGAEFPDGQEIALRMGHRTMLAVPLLREGEGVGVIALRRDEVLPFTDKQISLLQTFADQAVIAIGNVRLFEEVQAKTRDLSEALTYQTGSANILKVIASSPTDIVPALDAIVESACELCAAYDAVVVLKDGDDLVLSAHHGPIPMNQLRWPYDRRSVSGRAIADRLPVHLRDILSAEGEQFPAGQEMSRRDGCHTILGVPMLRESESIGAIVLRRTEVDPFGDKQIALLQTFADQALIAIGNVRLFEEVQAKTRDLTESLQQQTATADVLKVISRSAFDLQTVLDTLVESAARLCEADMAAITRKAGDVYFRAGSYGFPPKFTDYVKDLPVVPDRRTITGRTLLGDGVVHVADVLEDPDYEFEAQELSGNPRSFLGVPLLREGNPVGAMVLARRAVRPFSEKQIELLTTFADQAVIAIENARLFNEVQQRTRELSESLQFQTASSDVLKVISSSPDALQPVLDAIVETSRELCESDGATIVLFRDRKAHFAAVAGVPPQHFEYLRDNPASIDEPGSLFERMVREKRTLHLPNVMDDPELSRKPRTAMGGPRALLVAPLLRDGEPLGAIVLRQSHLKPFTPRQIQAIEVFADQAVIAISNVELFEQVQQRTRELTESLQQQTATSEVLQVISSSPGELAPVFEKMLENATRVCGAEFGSMFLIEDGRVRQAALYNAPPAFAAARVAAIRQPHPRGPLANAIESKQVIHVADVRTTPGYLEGSPPTVELAELGGARTIVVVPMLRDNEVIGVITVYRQDIRPFDDKQIDLLSNFAKQAVIAIENARLLGELRQRTEDLSKSLHDLRTAQDRLVQTEKLASLGQLTAGIAHEIKNPLNFVNNFAALSAELTEELNDVLKPAEIAEKVRAEVDELTGLLKDNLEKVVQHGKRADSIVKNMLLHSREGGGEHRLSDINALIDESLNLAYHGARAEKPGFNVTLEREFDPAAGQIDLFPQEITRVFLNLVSNGFYAVTKRNKEGGEPGFEPTLRASTKNLGESVEIRIRDNGTGIPPEVKEKMFNPFFTTKPAGEGTGLGLSMSHDIIVKQHGGTIDVDTEQGHFTEFRIVLPRTSNFAEKI